MTRPEVMVVGGGLIGCSIAWRLAQRGWQVSLAEAGRLGSQASWAGAGMLAPGGEVKGASLWAHRSVESLRMYAGFVQELQHAADSPIDFRTCGALELAYTEYELKDITRRSVDQAALGIRSIAMNVPEAGAMAPALSLAGLCGARYYPDDAIVNPRDLICALQIVLNASGVYIREETRLERLRSDVPTVLAAGAWSGELLPDRSLGASTLPVKGHLIGYDLPAGSLPPILRHGHTYILQRNNGFTIVGSTTEHVGFDNTVDPDTVARLHERGRRYLPTLLRASPDVSWTGLRPGVEGDIPQVGRAGNTDLWLAYGHYRNGILLAPITAKLISDDITASLGTG